MITKHMFAIILGAFIIIHSCSPQECKTLPTSFKDYQQAISLINKTRFVLSENYNTKRSSWIKGAKFYSCDLKKGFFILKTARKSYIHYNLPIELWNDFKNSESYGQYYNSYIKGKFKIKL